MPTVPPTLAARQDATITDTEPILYTVTATVLEIRSGPDVGYLNVGYLYKGDTVEIDRWLSDITLEECQIWARIVNTETWVCAKYLTEPTTFIPDEIYQIPEYDANTYIVCGGIANVYGRPAGNTILYTLPPGSIVRIREMSKGTLGWAMIEPARWVFMDYLCLK
jgi:hypothetical protein